VSDTPKCEPPEELREVDGWHWVQAPVGDPLLARWHAADRPGIEPLWVSTHHVYSGTPRYAAREWGWRYLCPVLTPAEAEALRAERDDWQQAARFEADQVNALRARVAVLGGALKALAIAVHNISRGGPPPDALMKLQEASVLARAALSTGSETNEG
jgi:hypothetical protein